MTSIDGAAAYVSRLGAGACHPSSAPSSFSVEKHAIPARTLYVAVTSNPGCAPAVPPSHARAAMAAIRGVRLVAIAGPHCTERAWGL